MNARTKGGTLLLTMLVMIVMGCASSDPTQAATNTNVSTDISVPVATAESNPQKYFVAPVPRDPRVDAILARFAAAEYEDDVINEMESLITDAAVGKDDKTLLRIALGRWYSNIGQASQAVEHLSGILAEEPPLFSPDPEEYSLEFIRNYYEARKSKSGGYGVERPDPGIQTIAVMDFQNASFSADADQYDRLGIGLPQLLLFQFESNVNLKVVERERLEWVMQENQMQQDANRFNQETAVRAGKLLGANAVVFGTFAVTGRDRVRITARVVKVETSEIIEVMRPIDGKVDDILDIADELAVGLARQLNASEDTGKVEDPTDSLEAMLAYAEGLDLYYTQGQASALEKFKLALQYDEGFEKARQKILNIEESIQMNMASAQD